MRAQRVRLPYRIRRVADDRAFAPSAWTQPDTEQCVPKDDVNNCGGCASDGSGHNCNTILAAAAVGCSRNGKCMACSWLHGGLRQRGDGDTLDCAEAVMPAFIRPPKRSAVDAMAAAALDDDDVPQEPLGVGYVPRWGPGRFDAAGGGQTRTGKYGEMLAQDAEVLLERADVEHQELVRLRAEVARYRAGAAPLPASDRMGGVEDDEADEAPLNKPAAANLKARNKPAADAKGGKSAEDKDDPLFDDSTDKGSDPESLNLVPRWLRRQLRGRRFATESDLHAFLAKAKFPPGDSDILSGVLGQQALALGIGKAAILARGADGTRKRTNAERFALDLPPLPPGNMPVANRRETVEQREKRMDRDEKRARAEIAAELEMRAAGATDEEIAELQPVIIGANGPVNDVSPWKRAIKRGSTLQLPDAARQLLLTFVDKLDDPEDEEADDAPPFLRADKAAPFAPVDRKIPAAPARAEPRRDIPKPAAAEVRGIAEPVRQRQQDAIRPIVDDAPIRGYHDVIPDQFGAFDDVPLDADADAGDEALDAAAESMRKLKDSLSPEQWRLLMDEHAKPY